jgi:hypothetical protein
LAPTGPETWARWQGRDVSQHLAGEKEKPTIGVIAEDVQNPTLSQLADRNTVQRPVHASVIIPPAGAGR